MGSSFVHAGWKLPLLILKGIGDGAVVLFLHYWFSASIFLILVLYFSGFLSCSLIHYKSRQFFLKLMRFLAGTPVPIRAK